MASQSIETPNIQESQIKTPEDLAKVLEGKQNRELAEKVRRFAKDQEQVISQTEDWKAKLKETLDAKDQGAIREAIPSESSHFDKGITSSEIAVQKAKKELASAIPGGEKSVEKLGKFEKWMNGFKDSFSKAWDLLKEGKFLAAIGVFWSGLKGKFNLEDWREKENKEKAANESVGNGEKNSNEAKYILGIKLLLGVSKEDTSIGYDILMQEKIRTQSYNQLGIDNLKESGLGEKFGLPGKDKDIFESLQIFKLKEKYIEKIIGKKMPDWKNLPLEKLIAEFNKYIQPFEKLKGISLDDLQNGKLGNIFSLNFSNDLEGSLNELLKDNLNDKNSKMHGVDKTFLAGIYASNSSEFEKNSLIGRKNSNEIFVEDFIAFRKDLPGIIGKNFYHGADDNTTKNEFTTYFNNYKFTQKEVLEFYIITNGGRDITQYNDFQNGLMFAKIFETMGTSNLRGKTYTFAIKESLKGNTQYLDKIPESFRNIMRESIKKVGKETISTLTGLIGEIWGALDGVEQASVIGGSLLLIAGFIYLRTPILIAKSLGVGMLGGIGIMSMAQIYDYLKSKPQTKTVLEKNNIKSPEELEKKFMG